jgi:hypothetical protein
MNLIMDDAGEKEKGAGIWTAPTIPAVERKSECTKCWRTNVGVEIWLQKREGHDLGCALLRGIQSYAAILCG